MNKNQSIAAIILGLFGAIVMLVANGCHENHGRHDVVESLRYHKDQRTNLCFAEYNLGYNSGALTMVPCSSEVERLLVTQP